MEKFLPERQRQLFLSQFQKDLDFFRLFFLLANKSGVIRHMGVLWDEEGPAATMGLNTVVGTAQAINSPCARYLNCDPDLDPEFCRIVNDFGAHDAESCEVSDRAAARRCRESGTTQVYSCHAGLVDIAVPVISDGDYIATLLCGQVLKQPPTEQDFGEVRDALSRLSYIDFERLRAAYWSVPVAGENEIQRAVNLMEAFAEHLATSWNRLSRTIREEHRALREAALLRMEFVHAVLDGSVSDREHLLELLRKLEVRRCPNRALVVRAGAEPRPDRGLAALEVRATASLHVIEEIADEMPDVVLTYLRKRGICVLFHDPGPDSPKICSPRSAALSERIVRALKRTQEFDTRIGIGGIKSDLSALAESYEEAVASLSQGAGPVMVFRDDAGRREELMTAIDRVARLVAARRLLEARQAAGALPLVGMRVLGPTSDSLETHRRFFRSALYPVAAAARQIGADQTLVERALVGADANLASAEPVVAIHEAYSLFVNQLLDECRDLYAGRSRRLADKALRLIRETIESGDPASRMPPARIAASLGISASHLSRTLKQVTGHTFENLVMRSRVEFAKKLLLNPELNVSEVASRSGFCDSGYFARVFRRAVGCSPREFMRDPLRGSAPGDLLNASASASSPPESPESTFQRTQVSGASPESHS